jgi:hypothetical protein
MACGVGNSKELSEQEEVFGYKHAAHASAGSLAEREREREST